ncbi:pyridoxamine 5'-phosphate oxidase family protein [Fodinicola feengrottensis]|uniref:Pyridoxamine 5'-phosphate oxidase family protein n=1 Tax=Fodinicola feengrottensis TaxID=435914 RepID=A0ABP4UYW9_9ACTN|nr:pyridoxamine 5'-phosphate oxidase family protein [Fodinicola feengrottensis]
MDSNELIAFVRERGLAVVASQGPDGTPQAALVGVAATDRGEIVFDTSAGSRKFANIGRQPKVALVIGWEDEVTVQLEGTADIITGAELERCQPFYFEQYPDGRDRAKDPDIAYVRVRPAWLRHCDFRPDTFGFAETTF